MHALPALKTDGFVPGMFQAASTSLAIGEPPGQTSARLFNERITKLTDVREQLGSYAGWNYVFISRICEAASALVPQIGIKKVGKPTQEFESESAKRQEERFRQHVRDYYGWCQNGTQHIEPIVSHPMLELLAKPNADDTCADLFYETVMYLELTGEYFWLLDRSGIGRRPVQVWAFARNRIWPYYDPQSGQLLHYKFRQGNGEIREFAPDEVIWDKLKSPLSKTDPMSPTFAGGQWTASEQQIEVSRFHRFNNGGSPDLFIEIDPTKYGDPDESVLDRLQTKVRNRLRPANTHGGAVVLPPGAKPNNVGSSPREMDWGTSAKDLRDNQGALRGVSKFIAGISEDMNHNQVIQALKQFWMLKMNPLAAKLGRTMSTKLLPMYDPLAIQKGAVVYFADGAPVDPELELKQDQADFQMGAISPDEVREKRGREAKGTPTMQTTYIQTTMVPVDEGVTVGPEPLAQDDTTDNPDEEPDPADAGEKPGAEAPAKGKGKESKPSAKK